MRIKRFFQSLNHRHYICFAVLVASVLCSVFVFPWASQRLGESFRDFGTSCAWYYSFLVNKTPKCEATVTGLTSTPLTMPWNLPNTWEEFKVAWKEYWALIFTRDNFSEYMSHVADVLLVICKTLLIVMPVFAIGIVVRSLNADVTNNDYNTDSKSLTRWKRLCGKYYQPFKRWCLDSVQFLKDNSYWYKLCLFVWVYNFNVLSIVVEALAFYLYFIVVFSFRDIYRQIFKLFVDLSSMLDFIPGVLWVCFALWLINRIRRSIGYKRLNGFENKNREFLGDRPIVTLWCGTMGTGKTTAITSAGISTEIIFRDKAFELLLETDLKFPFFPWINFENELKKAISRHSVYNLATCRRFTSSKAKAFAKRPCKQRIFMYDYERYGLTYDNKLEVVDIWKALEDYAQLYFIYTVESSLIISNYSVRTDNVKMDEGNFPLWNTDLFEKEPALVQAYSRHSHILDQDTLRLTKTLIADNMYADSFEFGVVLITEIGKERGNMLENKVFKKSDSEANPVNDQFNSTLKMIRHLGSVCNYCFVRILTDEQRPSSWGADAKDLADVVYIQSKSATGLAMPFFALEDLLLSWFHSKFSWSYSDYRYRRGDNTLPMYLYHGTASKLHSYYNRTYNVFGFSRWQVQVVNGMNESDVKTAEFFQMVYKDYKDRFVSDAFSDIWRVRSLRSLYGIEDLPEYQHTRATVDEFRKQNSYFMVDLLSTVFNGTDETPGLRP